jgi:formate dehydrogenase
MVRNYLPSHQIAADGGWNIADCVARSYDVEGMHVGTVAAGRIGLAVLRRLRPFDVQLHYTDRHRLPTEIEEELGLTFHSSAADMVGQCDVVTINAPLHPETEGMFDEKLIGSMKRGAYLINTARGDVVDEAALVEALSDGTIAGAGLDVYEREPQIAPALLARENVVLLPHLGSATTETRIAMGRRALENLRLFFSGAPLRDRVV